MIDIIIPTKRKSPYFERSILSLKYVPFPFNLYLLQEGNNWSHAINIGLSRSQNDVIIMDDDVILNEGTFKNFDSSIADIIGFTLRWHEWVSPIQHAGSAIHKTADGYTIVHLYSKIEEPIVVPHITTSLAYISRKVINKIGGFSEWEGYLLEDVDYSFRALLAGFEIKCVANEAVHYQTQTKGQFADWEAKRGLNAKVLQEKYLNNPEFIKFLKGKGFIDER